MDAPELLKKIGITDSGDYDTGNVYVVDIDEYDTFGKMFSKLEHSDLVAEVPSTSLITIHATDVTYQTVEDEIEENFIIKLQGDLDNNEYKLTVQQIK